MSSYKELLEQIARLQDEADILRKQERKDAIAAIRADMAAYGISIDDLGVSSNKNSMAPKPMAPAKFRDPVSGKTWSGRGRQPLWLTGDLSNFAVNQTN